jgi:hypothetical protein
MPHIVIQPRDARKAIVDEKGVGTELYEGIEFIERPSNYEVGTPGIFAFNLMYYPEHRYPNVLSGATFTVREGAKIVAHGVVLTRADPAAA